MQEWLYDTFAFPPEWFVWLVIILTVPAFFLALRGLLYLWVWILKKTIDK